MNLRELKPFGELDAYIDNPNLDEDSQRPITSLWEPQAGFIVQPRREPWGMMGKVDDTKKGEDGKDGRDGIDGVDGGPGPQGPAGPKGDKGSDATLPAGIIVFSTLADLGDGWKLCDGTDGTPDLRGRFIVTVGESPGANPQTYAVNCLGGYAWHGQSENNHNDHRLNHYHCFPVLTQFSCVDTTGGTGSFYAFSSNYVPCCSDSTGKVAEWCGTDDLPTQEAPVSSCSSPFYAKHKGPFNSCTDTDNRPPYIALYAHIKI